MRIQAATLVSTLLFSLSSLAASLTVQDTVDLLVVNMSEPALSGQAFNSVKTVELPAGKNQVLFKYEPVIESGEGRKKVYSHAQIVTFHVDANQELRFEMPKYRNVRLAEKGLKNLEFRIVDQDGNEISKVVDRLKSDGVQLGRNYIEEARQYNINGGQAAIAISYVAIDNQAPIQQADAVEAIAPPVESATISQSVELNQLQAWYLKTSKEDRKAFRKWMIDQE
ncbi:DUF2057 family protein [uncultured Vibrio sp.]|uniref:YccT family protein n=1 Tax=uncultured Vibrio sp. TaxID=114054 RepID=UPI00261ECB1C|nr:DUF2057 family protein [uncultured Vibrio sp.]